MMCRKKLSPRRRRLRRIFCFLLSAAVLLTLFVELVVKAQLTDVICQQMHTLSERAVNLAVTDFMDRHDDIGERMSRIVTDDSGSVSAICTDPAVINAYKAEITELAQEYIDRLSREEGVTVPIGSITGLVFLSEIGPDIRLDVSSRQTVLCDFSSDFSSAGINQTLHHINLTVDVELTVYNPYRISEKIHTKTTLEVAQTVIVGSVPTYGGVLSY